MKATITLSVNYDLSCKTRKPFWGSSGVTKRLARNYIALTERHKNLARHRRGAVSPINLLQSLAGAGFQIKTVDEPLRAYKIEKSEFPLKVTFYMQYEKTYPSYQYYGLRNWAEKTLDRSVWVHSLVGLERLIACEEFWGEEKPVGEEPASRRFFQVGNLEPDLTNLDFFLAEINP